MTLFTFLGSLNWLFSIFRIICMYVCMLVLFYVFRSPGGVYVVYYDTSMYVNETDSVKTAFLSRAKILQVYYRAQSLQFKPFSKYFFNCFFMENHQGNITEGVHITAQLPSLNVSKLPSQLQNVKFRVLIQLISMCQKVTQIRSMT